MQTLAGCFISFFFVHILDAYNDSIFVHVLSYIFKKLYPEKKEEKTERRSLVSIYTSRFLRKTKNKEG